MKMHSPWEDRIEPKLLSKDELNKLTVEVYVTVESQLHEFFRVLVRVNSSYHLVYESYSITVPGGLFPALEEKPHAILSL